MTTIIGIEYEDKSVIVADSRITDDGGKVYSHPLMKKIAQRGALLIAGAGEVSPCDIAQNIWIPPMFTAKDKKDPYRYIIVKAMPSLRKCLIDNGYNFDEPHDKAKEGLRFQFLIAVGGELFDVDQDLAVMKSEDGFYAIGSGGAYALGALYAGADAIAAMEVAARISAYTAAPYDTQEQSK
jgi:ATP-dependent protease HslVU (ClpYQ) peptidase subunit